MEALECKADTAKATGGSKPRIRPAPFHVDVIANTSLKNVPFIGECAMTCAAGSIVSQASGWESSRKAVGFWMPAINATKSNAGLSRKLEVTNASHVLLTEEVKEKFMSISILECSPAEPCDWGDYANIHVTVVAATRTFIYRWNLALGVSESFQHGADQWKNLPQADVLSLDWKDVATGVGYPSDLKLADCSLSSGLHIQHKSTMPDPTGPGDNGFVMSLSVEGADLVLRDARLSVITRAFTLPARARDPATEPFSGGSVVPLVSAALPSSYVCLLFSQGGIVHAVTEDGYLAAWDVSPCVHIDLPVQVDTEFDPLNQPPRLIYCVALGAAASQLVVVPPHLSDSVPQGGEGTLANQLLLASREGKVRHVIIHFHLHDDDSSKTCGDCWLVERYCMDLRRETRFTDGLVSSSTSNSSSSSVAVVDAGSGMVLGGSAARPEGPTMRSGAATLPLAMALSESDSSPCALVVTSSAVISLSLPSLAVLDCRSLPEVTGLDQGASITNTITTACATSSLVCVVPAFDRETRCLVRGLDVQHSSGGSMTARLEIARLERAEQQAARKSRRAAGVVLSEAAMAHTTKTSAEPAVEPDKRDILSFFLSQGDMRALGRTKDNDDDDEEVFGGEDSEEEGGPAAKGAPALAMASPSKRCPLLASFSPPPTPVVQRGVGTNAASVEKGRPAFSPAPSSARGGKVVDKPVTFHAKIKSSGYGQTPSTALGALEKKRKERLKQATKDRQLKRSGTAPAAVSAPQLRTYPTDCAPMHVHQKHNDYSFGAAEATAPALYRLRFSEDGSWLGIPSSDCAVTTLKTPLSRFKGDGSFYVSHNRAVTAVDFSHERERGVEGGATKQLVLSSSLDGTARIWKGGKVDGAAVVFSHERCSSSSAGLGSSLSRVSNTIGNTSTNAVKAATSTATKRRNRPYNGQVVDASFYYNDKFVVLGNENRLFLYSYRTESVHEQNDLKRLHSSGSYKVAHHWSFPASKSVTAIRCVNSVLSPIVFCASSDRSLHVCDAVSGAVTRSIPGAHDRAIHCIALPQPSVYAQLDQGAYNTFATAAMDNSVLVWDVRSPTVCVRYTDHTNRRENVECALSPCLRYLACGSEDKSARLVDLRTGRDLAKYTGFRDVVSAVAFHPLAPQVAVGSYDGSVKFYCSAI